MLNGQDVLIVEEEFLIALDLQRMLEALGCGQTLFARNTDEAMQLRSHWPALALAVVEQRLDDQQRSELPAVLKDAGVPVVLTSGDINMRHRAMSDPVLIKPIPEDDLASAVRLALASGPGIK